MSLLGVVALASKAQDTDSVFIRRIADEILLHSTAYSNLRTLTKQIGARLSGSPQMVQAEKWGLQAFRKANADSVWLQQCMVPHWVRGRKEELTIAEGAYKNRKLQALALGNSVGTGQPLKEQVIEIKNFRELDEKKNEVKGKIVFYNYPFNPLFIRTYQAYGDAVPYRTQGPSKAAKYGAKAVIVRSMSHSADNHPHTGVTIYDDTLPRIPAVAIGLHDAEWLSAQLKQNNLVVHFRSDATFLADTIGHNVIAEIKGSAFPDEYIVVGGHLDSWDVGEGAHDDGAGVVQTIEVLRTFKAMGYRPKRTIRFVLFANEENGLRGGNKYADEAKAKGEKHVFALESDAGGFTPRGFGLNAKAAQTEKIKSWGYLLEPYGLREFSEGGGADITPLNKTQGTVLAGLSPDSQRYFDVHHATSDVFENVNKRELELGAIGMAALIYLVDQKGL